jgi:hypothetical protein
MDAPAGDSTNLFRLSNLPVGTVILEGATQSCFEFPEQNEP